MNRTDPIPVVDPRDPVNPLQIEDSWFIDGVERLFADFEAHHSLEAILAVARQCRAELDGSGPPTAALPELVERLARQRLAPAADDPSAQAST